MPHENLVPQKTGPNSEGLICFWFELKTVMNVKGSLLFKVVKDHGLQ